MVKKKLSKAGEIEIEREISILENSQEKDKFILNMEITTFVSMVILITGFMLASLSGGHSDGVIGGFISLFGVGIYYKFFRVAPLMKSYKNKMAMVIERYEMLGINWKKLEKEIKNLK